MRRMYGLFTYYSILFVKNGQRWTRGNDFVSIPVPFGASGQQFNNPCIWMSHWKLGSLVKINGFFHLLINEAFVVVKSPTDVLTFDPSTSGQSNRDSSLGIAKHWLRRIGHWSFSQGACGPLARGRTFDGSEIRCPQPPEMALNPCK